MREPWRPSTLDYTDKAYQQKCRRLSQSICRDTLLYVIVMFCIKGGYVLAMSGPPGWLHPGDICVLSAMTIGGVSLLASIFVDLKTLLRLSPPRVFSH